MSVRDYIKAEIDRSPSGIDVNVLASNVIRSIPAAEMPVIVHELMVSVIHRETSRQPSSDGRLTFPRPTRSSAPEPAAPGQVGRSKWDVLAPYRAVLDRCQSIDGQMYRLGDLTADQLRHAADARRRQADTMVRNAEWYEKIAAACDEHAVAKADDLPDRVLEALHGELAA